MFLSVLVILPLMLCWSTFNSMHIHWVELMVGKLNIFSQYTFAGGENYDGYASEKGWALYVCIM